MISLFLLSMWTMVLIFVIATLFWFWLKWRNRKLIQVANTLPTVEPTLPLLGHIHHVIGDLDGVVYPFLTNTSLKAASNHQGEFCFFAGPVPYIITQRPEDIQMILNSSKTLEKGHEYELAKVFIGNGVFTSPVPIWKKIRKHLQPMFQQRNVEQMESKFNEQGRQLASILSAHGRDQVDVLPTILSVTMNSIFYFLLGEIVGPSAKHFDIFSQQIMRVAQLWATRLFKIWYHWDFIFNLVYRNESQELTKWSKDFTAPAVKVFEEKLGKEEEEDEDESVGTRGTVTLIDAYTALSRSDPQFKETFHHEVLLLCTAGTDTNSITMASCLLALASHPNIQEKVYEEITSVVGTTEDVTLQSLNKMSYLEQVFKETLRRFTVIPFITRETTEDFKLSFGVLPAGSNIMICIYGVHMNPDIYPDPFKFDPDRFCKDNVAGRHKMAHIPLSAGPRNCLGKEYAMMAMKTTLVYILREFKISTDVNINDTEFVFQIELVRKGGYPVRFKRRT